MLIKRLAPFALLWVIGCTKPVEKHMHEPGSHGGIIVSVGQDHYHAEILFAEGRMRVYMLDQDQAKVIDIETQDMEAYIRPFGEPQAFTVKLAAQPQDGDAKGKTSLFVGDLPKEFKSSQWLVNVPLIKINGERYRFSFATSEPVMPTKVVNDQEKELYLQPGGKYTLEDILANGSQTASQKFANFMSAHDMNPKPGARICPITRTLANAECSWVIGGQEYRFCCPPCIDEFVKLAKEKPQEILNPEEYVK